MNSVSKLIRQIAEEPTAPEIQWLSRSLIVFGVICEYATPEERRIGWLKALLLHRSLFLLLLAEVVDDL